MGPKALGVAHRGSITVQVVGPTVIGANDLPRTVSAVVVEQDVGTMPANVVKGFYLIVLRPHDESTFFAELEGDVTTGLRQIAGVADQLPRGEEDVLFFRVKKVLTVVNPCG